MPGEEMIRWTPVPDLPMEPDPEWVAYFERVYSEALAFFEDAQPLEIKHLGESPLRALVRRQGRVDENGPVHGFAQRRLNGTRCFGIPRREVNLSREAMGLLADALDETLECYGTSGDLEPRGYWMPIDVESDHRLAPETNS